MSRSLKLLHSLIDPSDATLLFGSEAVRKDVAIAGDTLLRSTVTVADNYNLETLWTSGDGGVSTFTHALILSDNDILVELRTDNGTPEFSLIQVKANCPTYIGGFSASGTATALTDDTQSVEDTDFDSIDRIQAQRNVADAVGDATVTIVLLA